MYKQIIIVRKDLNMSHGKMAAQVAHASMSFLSWFIRNNADSDGHIDAWFDKGILDNWINGIYTKVVLQAKNRNQLMKAVALAEELGLVDNFVYIMKINDDNIPSLNLLLLLRC